MNDFDYDVYQKKKAVSGARHRVNGSKSKKCTLLSDQRGAEKKTEWRSVCNESERTYHVE